ncbi:MAG: Na/Pi cotransporter family protein [Clostridia bacterium]|nr:Na/Pi cotransporter family protein [Clostridia bacterium]
MDFFKVLELVGGLCLFLFGMNLMGTYLEKSAGSGLKNILGRLTSGKFIGFLTGLAVTAVIQSSSATTVMVVGFVNSGLMTLRQAINVIIGANVGTTVTAWILSLTGIEGSNFFVRLLTPSSFVPVLALVGILLYMGAKKSRRKDIGVILLGFATLMFGMETMSGAVSGLKGDPTFASILTMFDNPILGVLAGALLTAIIQSSSASVGILQALSSTGQITVGMSVPIIMGQNIGTCVTALISSVGANRNARRASLVHLIFNLLGTAAMLLLFSLARALFSIPMLSESADAFTIAVCHSVFNIVCTLLMFPLTGLLEYLAVRLIPDDKNAPAERVIAVDERLMATPSVAISQCRRLTMDMARSCIDALQSALTALEGYSDDLRKLVVREEKDADRYEDILGSYLVRLNSQDLSEADSREAAQLLHIIGDFERISDHAVNVVEAAGELQEKGIAFTGAAKRELAVLCAAVMECAAGTVAAFCYGDESMAVRIEPLEHTVDKLKEQLRARHIRRMQQGNCSIEAGFVWSDLITNLERVTDHCSNVACCLVETGHNALGMHSYTHALRADNANFSALCAEYAKKYALDED